MIVFFFSTLLRFMRNPASLFLPAVKMGSGRREPVRTFGAIMHQNKKGSGRPLRSAGTLYHRIPSYKEPSDRSSDFRIVARPRLPVSLSACGEREPVAHCDRTPRLQRRDRRGFTPRSEMPMLFNKYGQPIHRHRARCQPSTVSFLGGSGGQDVAHKRSQSGMLTPDPLNC